MRARCLAFVNFVRLHRIDAAWPTGQHAVRAWVVDDFPAAFTDWKREVTALELSRTF